MVFGEVGQVWCSYVRSYGAQPVKVALANGNVMDLQVSKKTKGQHLFDEVCVAACASVCLL